MHYNVQADKFTASFLSNTEMSRSWSSAHDWKSCKGQKLFESSNLSISANGSFIVQCAHWTIPLFFRTGSRPHSVHTAPLRKNACESLHLRHEKEPPPQVGVLFHKCLERFECVVAHASGMCMSQCEHWRIHLFFRTGSRPHSVHPLPCEKMHANLSISAYMKNLFCPGRAKEVFVVCFGGVWYNR